MQFQTLIQTKMLKIFKLSEVVFVMLILVRNAINRCHFNIYVHEREREREREREIISVAPFYIMDNLGL